MIIWHENYSIYRRNVVTVTKTVSLASHFHLDMSTCWLTDVLLCWFWSWCVRWWLECSSCMKHSPLPRDVFYQHINTSTQSWTSTDRKWLQIFGAYHTVRIANFEQLELAFSHTQTNMDINADTERDADTKTDMQGDTRYTHTCHERYTAYKHSHIYSR